MPEMDTALNSLPGVGGARAAAFDRLGLFCVRDLLYHFPRAYQHRGDVRSLSDIRDGDVCSVILNVATAPVTSMLPNRRRMTLTKFSAVDDTGRATITFFNQSYLTKVFNVGSCYRFYGKFQADGARKMLTSPIFEPYIEGAPMREFTPVYPLAAPLTQKFMSNMISALLPICENIESPIPQSIIEQNGLCSYAEAINSIHFPNDMRALERARDYFIFEELFLFSSAVAISGGDSISSESEAPHIDAHTPIEDFYRALPFTLTCAQQRAIGEIFADMSSGGVMKRLVSGDVGSGKTVCAAAAVYLAAVNGYQSAMMAPTEILASQHYSDLAPLLEKFGIKSALLTGAMSAAAKKRIYTGLSDGSIMFCIGTHALLSAGVKFERLGLAVTDEQHRFGVRQRNLLSRDQPHVLVMSATPIPRTLAMILYGDLKVSTIDELPPGRQKVDTFVVGESYRQRLNAFIAKQVSEGHSVYIVCPSVEGSDTQNDSDEDECGGELFSLFDMQTDNSLPLKNTRDYATALREALPDIEIGVLHGRMKNSEKDDIMRRFADGSISVLVSTTVIEVGVNVPNATLMIVENAERFGLSQLHQLRGRVGRGSAKSYCVLVSDSQTETARARLNVMKNNSNGFDIAKFDLEQRGPGDFFPKDGDTRQHGALSMRLASLCDNMDVLIRANEAARSIINHDPELSQHPALSEAVTRIMSRS